MSSSYNIVEVHSICPAPPRAKFIDNDLDVLCLALVSAVSSDAPAAGVQQMVIGLSFNDMALDLKGHAFDIAHDIYVPDEET